MWVLCGCCFEKMALPALFSVWGDKGARLGRFLTSSAQTPLVMPGVSLGVSPFSVLLAGGGSCDGCCFAVIWTAWLVEQTFPSWDSSC